MLFLVFTAGLFSGVLVGVPLGFMLRYALDLYELPRAADEPYSSFDRIPAFGMWADRTESDDELLTSLGDGWTFRDVRDGGATVHANSNGHE